MVCLYSALVQYQRVWYEPMADTRLAAAGPVPSRPDILEPQHWASVMRGSSVQYA